AEVVLRSLPRDVGPLLYPAARDRAGSLPDDLATRGYDVRTIEAYRAEPVARLDPLIRDALAAGSIAGILVYSRRTAKALLDIADTEGIKEALRRPVYYVISEHAAEAVRELGAPVVVAENPDEDSLFALIPAAC
ncbi:MAG: uroporphyrinogen-III synthase, partial [Bauldia sp.]|nr:uroporphyrinogen-III synthase [Bauldia sp.]